ncbi:MAG: hypothetical protein AAF799_03100 [Myxococcota bacterium]
MNKKELNLSDLKNVRGAAAIGKWKKTETWETEPVEGVPTCKCHDEVAKGAAAAAAPAVPA